MIYRDINISILWWAAPPPGPRRPTALRDVRGPTARPHLRLHFNFMVGCAPQAPAGLRNKHKYKYNYVGHVKRHSNLSEKLNC